MPFPESDRVIYSHNPLEAVICQLRFPPILKITTQEPAEYQESIRQEYPFFEERSEGIPDLPSQFAEQLPKEFAQLIGGASRKIFDFSSIDEKWTISLARDFLALSAKDYERWEQFEQHFEIPFNKLLQEYKPALFTRVGLRYQNVIRRSELGIANDTPWSELIQPYIAGSLGAPDLDPDSVMSTIQTVEIRLQHNYGKVKIRHGLAIDNATKETCYLIDNDFSAEKIKESENVIDRLNRFNRRARRLFRWCIQDKLHEAMEPRSI